MIVSRTPFRVSFLGGGTDFPSFYEKHGGCCIATTIDKYSYIYLREIEGSFGFSNEFLYSKIERTGSDLTQVQHPIIREALISEGLNGLRIDYDADIPARTGLGTSSSFSVGLINSLYALRGIALSRREIADKAIYLERVLCKEAGGIQDQISSSFGGFNFITFSQTGYEVERLTVPNLINLERNLLLFYTGIQRTSSKIQSSIKLDDETVESNLLQLKGLTLNGIDVLRQGDFDLFGKILGEAWKLKKSLSTSVSTSEIDSLYARAIEAGALGGKILGAGGGGFLLFYVPPHNQLNVRKALSNLTEILFKFEHQGSHIIFNTESF